MTLQESVDRYWAVVKDHEATGAVRRDALSELAQMHLDLVDVPLPTDYAYDRAMFARQLAALEQGLPRGADLVRCKAEPDADEALADEALADAMMAGYRALAIDKAPDRVVGLGYVNFTLFAACLVRQGTFVYECNCDLPLPEGCGYTWNQMPSDRALPEVVMEALARDDLWDNVVSVPLSVPGTAARGSDSTTEAAPESSTGEGKLTLIKTVLVGGPFNGVTVDVPLRLTDLFVEQHEDESIRVPVAVHEISPEHGCLWAQYTVTEGSENAQVAEFQEQAEDPSPDTQDHSPEGPNS